MPETLRNDESGSSKSSSPCVECFKFIARLTLACARRSAGEQEHRCCRMRAAIEIAVTDPARPSEESRADFEFQQADGTPRKSGGTGLGLSIARDRPTIGGECRSLSGRRLDLTLFHPLEAMQGLALESGAPARGSEQRGGGAARAADRVRGSDDRDDLGDDVRAVVEGRTFAAILLDMAHEAWMKGVVATAGAALWQWSEAAAARDPPRPRPSDTTV